MLTGALPATGENFNQIMMSTINGTPPPIASTRPAAAEPVPSLVEQVVMLGLTKDPQRRPVMAEFQSLLVAAVDAFTGAGTTRGAPLAASVMRSFTPAPTNAPTLSAGMD